MMDASERDEDAEDAIREAGAGDEGGHGELQGVLPGLRRRGMADPLLVVSDGAPGIIRAIEECLPRTVRQRCIVHKMRNLQSKLPDDVWPEFKAPACACYQAASPAFARPTAVICPQQ